MRRYGSFQSVLEGTRSSTRRQRNIRGMTLDSQVYKATKGRNLCAASLSRISFDFSILYNLYELDMAGSFRLLVPFSFRGSLILPLLCLPITTLQTCYFPSGDTAASDIPCSTSGDSACCISNGYCLSNGLCITEMVLAWGSCTDQTWTSSACPSFCRKGPYIYVQCKSCAKAKVCCSE